MPGRSPIFNAIDHGRESLRKRRIADDITEIQETSQDIMPKRWCTMANRLPNTPYTQFSHQPPLIGSNSISGNIDPATPVHVQQRSQAEPMISITASNYSPPAPDLGIAMEMDDLIDELDSQETMEDDGDQKFNAIPGAAGGPRYCDRSNLNYNQELKRRDPVFRSTIIIPGTNTSRDGGAIFGCRPFPYDMY